MKRLRRNDTVWPRSRSGTRKRLVSNSAWIAQHHFHEAEGGLPAPFAFLGFVAAQTSRIRLGTGIVTLPLENPVRVAEDAAVLDLLSNGRLELGVGTGGNPTAFAAFGLDSAERARIFADNLDIVRNALAGRPLPGGDTLYPPRPQLCDRIWQATFSVSGGARAGKAGDGLLLSRTQPRPREAPHAPLAEIQHPIIDAYLEALPSGCEPRIMASRSVFAADDRGRRCISPASGCGAPSMRSSSAVMRRRAMNWRHDRSLRRPCRHTR